ncbi:MAG: DUF1553 domain-containing protein [Planctomycetota bacterium]|nr:DUF1553 domain-containing protein [Planctomycetota bacterium]
MTTRHRPNSLVFLATRSSIRAVVLCWSAILVSLLGSACRGETSTNLVVSDSSSAASGTPDSVLADADATLAPMIDQWISAAWPDTTATPAPAANDAEFVRRLYLDLVGRLPLPAEQKSFLSDQAPLKRRELVDRLLNGEEYPIHFANQLTTHLLGRTALPAPKEWTDWLRQSLTHGKGWHTIVREILSAPPTPKDESGPAEFLVRKLSSNDPLDGVTRDVTRLFFGVDMQCARCHTHPEIPEWEPESYWGMAAFFNRSYLVEIDGRKVVAERARGEAVYTPAKSTDKITAEPRFMTGVVPPPQEAPPTEAEERINARKALYPEAKLDDPLLDNPDEYAVPPTEKPTAPSRPLYSRRAALIDMAIDANNPYFSRAIVNRAWAWLMGQGLVEPLDQLHSANSPTHPELLDALSEDFAAHNYDLRRLVRNIALSDTYQRSSVRLAGGEPPPRDLYLQAQVRPLSEYQMAVATLGAAGLMDGSQARADFEKANTDRIKELVLRFDTGSDQFAPSLALSLYLANNESFAKIIAEGGLVKRLLDNNDNEELIRTAFASVLSRAPDADEVAALRYYLAARSDRREQACQQIVWSLLTSSEFRFNH